jgi:hypothetical protein
VNFKSRNEDGALAEIPRLLLVDFLERQRMRRQQTAESIER